MKQAAVLIAILMMGPVCLAQHGGMAIAGRADFASACGISDSSDESALFLRHAADESWSEVGPDGREIDDLGSARVWHKATWMVELRDTPGRVMTSVHTANLCFDEWGHVRGIVDTFMDMPECGCLRQTAINLNADGEVTAQEQKYVSIATGAQIKTPQQAAGFPPVWNYRRLDELPFYSLLKK